MPNITDVFITKTNIEGQNVLTKVTILLDTDEKVIFSIENERFSFEVFGIECDLSDLVGRQYLGMVYDSQAETSFRRFNPRIEGGVACFKIRTPGYDCPIMIYNWHEGNWYMHKFHASGPRTAHHAAFSMDGDL